MTGAGAGWLTGSRGRTILLCSKGNLLSVRPRVWHEQISLAEHTHTHAHSTANIYPSPCGLESALHMAPRPGPSAASIAKWITSVCKYVCVCIYVCVYRYQHLRHNSEPV